MLERIARMHVVTPPGGDGNDLATYGSNDNDHSTGCSFAAAVAARRAHGPIDHLGWSHPPLVPIQEQP